MNIRMGEENTKRNRAYQKDNFRKCLPIADIANNIIGANE